MRKLTPLFLIMALVGFSFQHTISSQIDPSRIFLSPGASFWGGTDSLGRDLLQRSLRGAGLSLLICLFSLILTYVMGMVLGGVLSFWKRANHLVIFIVDVFDSIPNFLLVALFSILISRGFVATSSANAAFSILVISIALSAWPPIARYVRLEILQLKGKDFLNATIVLGGSPFYLARTHYLRAIWPWVKLSAAHSIPQFILIESVLSFTGFGMNSDYATLGYLIFEGWKNALIYPHLFVVPSVILCLIIWILTWGLQETKELF
ncbi:MAG: ABC transporter permease [Bdellovibrionaceae bacterium]|nr:ABC transporter permease [Pseudobdellovibrionaceae bacterium]